MARQSSYTITELRGAGASAGVALTTTAALTSLPPGTQYIGLTPRNFATAVVARVAINPTLVVLISTDGLTNDAFNASFLLQDGDNTTTLGMNSFPALASGGIILVGSTIPFRGVAVDVQNTNSTAATLTVDYPISDDTWASISATDGTASGGAPFAQDGNVTWTIPTAWAAASLNRLYASKARKSSDVYNHKLYWTRWSVDAAFDASVSVNQMRPLARSTAYFELVPGELYEQLIPTTGYQGFSTVEALTDAGTANLVIQCGTINGSEFLPVA